MLLFTPYVAVEENDLLPSIVPNTRDPIASQANGRSSEVRRVRKKKEVRTAGVLRLFGGLDQT